jgi:hypothetical protein
MPGILRFVLQGRLTVDDVKAFVVAHNRAIDELRGRDYKVWVDIRQTNPLSPEGTEVMEEAKRYTAAQPNFRGTAVLVAGALVALQHRRTSAAGGVADSELISGNEEECLRFIQQVWRGAPKK